MQEKCSESLDIWNECRRDEKSENGNREIQRKGKRERYSEREGDSEREEETQRERQRDREEQREGEIERKREKWLRERGEKGDRGKERI